MSDKLKPCPFCGGEPKLYEDTVDSVGAIAADGGHYIGTCSTKCRCHFVGYFQTQEAAIAAWNTRTDQAAEMLAAIVELRKALEKVGFACTDPFRRFSDFEDDVFSALNKTKKWIEK